MTHNKLMAMDMPATAKIHQALRAVAKLCATQDEVTIGDKGLFNSGRNSMRDEIKQAIEKELM